MGQDAEGKPVEGDGSFGPAYGAAVAVPALVEHGRRLVRNRSGTEVVSETTLRVPFGVACPAAGHAAGRHPVNRQNGTTIQGRRAAGAVSPGGGGDLMEDVEGRDEVD